jgi:4-amino-4-deoxy-L-arabinose transferase-like glycosyltransferase
LGGIVLLSIGENLAFLAHSGGARTVGDASAFLRAADGLVSGRGIDHVHVAYSGYVVLIAILKWLGLSMNVLALLQVAAVVVAGVALYDIGRTFVTRTAGLFAAAVVMLDPDIARWNRDIVTNALFMSFVVYSVWGTLMADRRRTLRWYALATVVAVLSASLRPTGWLVPPIVAAFLIGRRLEKPALRWATFAALACLTFALMVGWSLPRGRLAAASPVRKLQSGVVIPGYVPWQVSMPRTSRTEGVGAAVSYAGEHPLAVAKLAAIRVGAEFGSVRPFYGPLHNGYLVLRLIILVPLAVVGWRRLRGNPVRTLVSSFVVVNAVWVGLTFASWDGRFVLYVLPLIALLSGEGLAVVRRRFLRRRDLERSAVSSMTRSRTSG